MDKKDYLGSQFDCLRCIARKAEYANNGMLITYIPQKENYEAYTAYVRSLVELEKAVALCLSRLGELVCAETLTKSMSIWDLPDLEERK